jgi:hypothetical protein
MPITWGELPRQAAELDFNNPRAKREYWVDGTLDRTEALLKVAQESPAFESSIDADGNPILLFRDRIPIEERGGGGWGATVYYENFQNSIQLNVSLGVQSVKIFQAYSTVASYNLENQASSATNAAATAAIEAATEAQADAATASADALAAFSAALDAITLANVVGVDPAVKTFVLAAASATQLAATAAMSAAAKVNEAAAHTLAAAIAATAGDYDSAQAAATLAQGAVDDATTFVATALTQFNAAVSAAEDAETAASGGSAESIAAAAAATTAAAAASAAYSSALAAKIEAQAAATAAQAAADAVLADTAPGGNGIPDFRGVIGGNGDTVEATEVEVAKFEFSITKKWQRAVLPSSYLNAVAELLNPRTAVNNATFVINVLGQVLSFPKGSLRFRGFQETQQSNSELQITYNFAYERGITAADDYRIGNSVPIVKEGWQHLDLKYRKAESASTVVTVPYAATVLKIYPYGNFATLEI